MFSWTFQSRQKFSKSRAADCFHRRGNLKNPAQTESRYNHMLLLAALPVEMRTIETCANSSMQPLTQQIKMLESKIKQVGDYKNKS
jgi:hypothetical protein